MLCEKRHLFEARTNGYHNYRIPGLLVTERGVVLATTEARGGKGGDWDGNDLLLCRSLDGGKTWEPPRLLVAHDQYGEGPISNCVMIGDAADGVVHALYCHQYARVFYLRSDDDGATFSAPIEITGAMQDFHRSYPWRVIATGPGHGTQLRNGRIIVPLWMSDGTGSEFGPGKLGHRPSCVSLIYSDDHGARWQCGEIAIRHEAVKNPSETAMVELADGRVMLNVRSESDIHRRLITISPNGVDTWSPPVFDDALLEPICMASLIRYAWPTATTPGRIIFANPDTLERTMTTWAHDRKRLTLKMSMDDGTSWPYARVLEEGPSGYSDLAILPDGTILCLYEDAAIEQMYDSKYLTLARVNLEWLMASTG